MPLIMLEYKNVSYGCRLLPYAKVILGNEIFTYATKKEACALLVRSHLSFNIALIQNGLRVLSSKSSYISERRSFRG